MEENNPNGRRILSSVKPVAESKIDKAPVKHPIFCGCFTALITPFRGGKVDEKTRFQRWPIWQVKEEISGLVPWGNGRVTNLSHRSICG